MVERVSDLKCLRLNGKYDLKLDILKSFLANLGYYFREKYSCYNCYFL